MRTDRQTERQANTSTDNKGRSSRAAREPTLITRRTDEVIKTHIISLHNGHCCSVIAPLWSVCQHWRVHHWPCAVMLSSIKLLCRTVKLAVGTGVVFIVREFMCTIME